jgi:hypothetical protein
MAEAASKMRGSADASRRYKQQMEAAGFVNVTEVIYKWPSNRWPKDKKFKELGEFGPKKNSCSSIAANMTCKECG